MVEKKTGERKRISPIFILQQYRSNGYASCAIKAAESIHGEFGWEIDTILQEIETCRFYENLGYKLTGKKKLINSKMTLVYYAK